MLALARKRLDRTHDEKYATLLIGPDIRIIVQTCKGDNVRLLIEAPEDVDVWRAEVYEKILKEGKARKG
jgi:carbon storage regulator CsrA